MFNNLQVVPSFDLPRPVPQGQERFKQNSPPPVPEGPGFVLEVAWGMVTARIELCIKGSDMLCFRDYGQGLL